MAVFADLGMVFATGLLGATGTSAPLLPADVQPTDGIASPMSRQTMIESLVRSAYRRYGYTQLNKVDCHVDRNKLVLTGELPTYHLKQVAQTIAMSLPQVVHVENRITVPMPTSNSNGAARALPHGG